MKLKIKKTFVEGDPKNPSKRKSAAKRQLNVSLRRQNKAICTRQNEELELEFKFRQGYKFD